MARQTRRTDGDRDGRAGPHGRQHGAAPAARRPPGGGLEPDAAEARELAARAPRPARTSPTWLKALTPRARLGDAARRRRDAGDDRRAHARCSPRRHHRRRRQLQLPTTRSARAASSAQGHRAIWTSAPAAGSGASRTATASWSAATREAFERIEPLLTTLAPPDGYLYCGPAGAGHFVKMVHNGIEYGMMQAYAEGFELLHASEFELDLATRSRRSGTTAASCALAARAGGAAPSREDTGPGRPSAATSTTRARGAGPSSEAIDHDVPAPVITLSLFARFALAPGRLLQRPGARRAAQRVRRPRGEGVGRTDAMASRAPCDRDARRDEAASAATGRSGTQGRPPLRAGCAWTACRSRAAMVIFGATGDLTAAQARCRRSTTCCSAAPAAGVHGGGLRAAAR